MTSEVTCHVIETNLDEESKLIYFHLFLRALEKIEMSATPVTLKAVQSEGLFVSY